MDLNIHQLTEQFITESFSKAGRKHEVRHLQRTAYWLRQIYPQADEAMLVAAISHDIERAFRANTMSAKEKELGFIHVDFFRIHEERGAEIMVAFLRGHNQPGEFITKVSRLISRHEEGGDKEQNILKDADSLSFLENNIDHFITDKIRVNGYDAVREKICWMFDRITTREARQLALPFYEDAIRKLNKIKNSDR